MDEKKKVEACEICGSNDFPEFIQRCALCRLTREHTYCTRTYKQRPIASFWACDGCRFGGHGDIQHLSASSNAKHDEPIQRPILGQSSLLRRNRVPSRKSPIPDIPTQVVPRNAPFRRSGKGLSGDGSIREIFDFQVGPSLAYNLIHFEYPSHRPDPNYMWKGSLRIVNLDGKVYDSIQVHRPLGKCRYSWTRNGFTRERSTTLSFNLMPRNDIWAEIFETDFARAQDMSFYFFPGDSEGEEEQYCSLLNLLENEDLAMRSCLNDVVETLLFHSKKLNYDAELESPCFIWGKIRLKKSEQSDANRVANCASQIHAQGSEVVAPKIPPGFCSKVTSKTDDRAVSGSSTVLVEIPVGNDQAYVDGMEMDASGVDAAGCETEVKTANQN